MKGNVVIIKLSIIIPLIFLPFQIGARWMDDHGSKMSICVPRMADVSNGIELNHMLHKGRAISGK